MANIFGVIGMVLVFIGVIANHRILETATISDEAKGKINLIVLLFVIVSMGSLSYVVFL